MGLAAAAKLPNSYIPPPHNAATAGGQSFLQAPGSPSNQYLPPGQGSRPQATFNHAGQPSSFSQGSFSTQGGFPSGAGHAGAGHGGVSSYQGGSAQQYHGPQQPHIPILRYENVNNGDGSYHFE